MDWGKTGRHWIERSNEWDDVPARISNRAQYLKKGKWVQLNWISEEKISL